MPRKKPAEAICAVLPRQRARNESARAGHRLARSASSRAASASEFAPHFSSVVFPSFRPCHLQVTNAIFHCQRKGVFAVFIADFCGSSIRPWNNESFFSQSPESLSVGWSVSDFFFSIYLSLLILKGTNVTTSFYVNKPDLDPFRTFERPRSTLTSSSISVPPHLDSLDISQKSLSQRRK